MLLAPVDPPSTDVYAIGYEPMTGELQIQFMSGRIYSYPNFPPTLYAMFANAPSKGSFVAIYIKKVYPSTRIL